MLDKNWRPENWEWKRRVIAEQPTVWSPAGQELSPTEQLIEHTAEALMEEVAKELVLTEKTEPANIAEGIVAKALVGNPAESNQ